MSKEPRVSIRALIAAIIGVATLCVSIALPIIMYSAGRAAASGGENTAEVLTRMDSLSKTVEGKLDYSRELINANKAELCELKDTNVALLASNAALLTEMRILAAAVTRMENTYFPTRRDP